MATYMLMTLALCSLVAEYLPSQSGIVLRERARAADLSPVDSLLLGDVNSRSLSAAGKVLDVAAVFQQPDPGCPQTGDFKRSSRLFTEGLARDKFPDGVADPGLCSLVSNQSALSMPALLVGHKILRI